MRQILTLLLTTALIGSSYAQKFHLNLFGGASNYQGDLQSKRFTFSQARLAYGGGLSYELTDRIMLKTGITLGKITADDKLNPKNPSRNLNFTSRIAEVQLVGEYYLRGMNDFPLSPYVFGGVAIFHYNPYTYDSTGAKVYLRPLSTEGQGFYNNKKSYSLTQISIPFGAGVKLTLTDNIHVGAEIGLRKTFTDYLDDVSTAYVDKDLLLSNRGQQAVALAYRTSELKNGAPYPAGGTQRGSAKYKDLYYFSGITLSFRLGAGDHYFNKHSLTRCPRRLG